MQPLEGWVRNRANWIDWQRYRPQKNEFNRKYIFSLMNFYHERDMWLFGGVFEVLACHPHPKSYEVVLTEQGEALVGRMKLLYSYKDMAGRVKFEKHYGALEIAEISREPYSGRVFPGYDGIDLSFDELEAIVMNDRPDWKQALEFAKGVYLITDTSTWKRYVGSAYGRYGIWSRWKNYVVTGHGDNVELKKLVTNPTLDYCRKNFRFALLEHRNVVTDDHLIIAREVYWKGILFTHGEMGLNPN